MNNTTENVTRPKLVFHVAPVAALAAARISPALAADRSSTDPGPRNSILDGQNAASTWPPTTDSKSRVQAFKYPFSLANKRTYQGGWSREVTVRELPVSKSIAGVNMRLTAGGVRELHWHTAGEWAIMLYGTARITAIDHNGKSFVADVKKNDLWFSLAAFHIRFKALSPMGRSSCWCSTMEIFRGLRELHWHPNADEWQYFISGKGRMTVVATGNKARTMDFQAGDVGYVGKSLLHYVENTGDTDLVFLEMFKSSNYQDLSPAEWLAHTPPELVMAQMNADSRGRRVQQVADLRREQIAGHGSLLRCGCFA